MKHAKYDDTHVKTLSKALYNVVYSGLVMRHDELNLDKSINDLHRKSLIVEYITNEVTATLWDSLFCIPKETLPPRLRINDSSDLTYFENSWGTFYYEILSLTRTSDKLRTERFNALIEFLQQPCSLQQPSRSLIGTLAFYYVGQPSNREIIRILINEVINLYDKEMENRVDEPETSIEAFLKSVNKAVIINVEKSTNPVKAQPIIVKDKCTDKSALKAVKVLSKSVNELVNSSNNELIIVGASLISKVITKVLNTNCAEQFKDLNDISTYLDTSLNK